MQSDTTDFSLGELVTLIRGNTYKSALLGQPGPVLLGLASIQRDGGFRGDSLKTYGGESAEKLLLRPGELYVSLKDVTQSGDLLGSVARLPKSVPLGRLTQDTVKLQFDPERYPADLLYWTLRCPEYRSYCRERAIGTTNLSLSRDDFLAFQLPLATAERLELVALLEEIEHRINLLRQTSSTLESIAQTFFKSWFIDFDPVRAKNEGREPEGMDPATAALFPTEFEESTLGLIPKGWRVATVADAVVFNPLRSLPKRDEAPYLEMANAPTAGHRPLARVGLRAFGSGCKFRNGDALLAKITPCLENGKSAFVDFLDKDEIGWGSTEFIVMRAKPVLPEYCAYLLARHEAFRQFAIQAMTGTSGRQRVELSRLTQFPLALPPDESIASSVAPTFGALQSRIAANDEQAKALAELRDALLPRLISGKLRLPDAQEQVEEALT